MANESKKFVVDKVFLTLAFGFFCMAWILNNSLPAEPTGVSRLTAPQNEQKIWIKNREPVRFEWVGKASADSVLEIARDRSFQNVVLEEVGPISPYLADKFPGEGDYFYRIVQYTADQKPIATEPIAFTVVTKDPPKLTYPFSPLVFPEAKPLRFYWQGKHGVKFYRFQIALDGSFENLFCNLLIKETQTLPLAIPAGHFFWRVRGEDNENATTSWSEVRVLDSESRASLAASPQKSPPSLGKTLASPVVAKTNQKILLRYAVSKNLRGPAAVQKAVLNPPLLKWGKSAGATTYEVQVSRKSDFSQLDWSKNTAASETKWTLAMPGKFFWRVQAIDASGNKSAFSSPNVLALNLSTPKMKKVFSHIVKIKTKAQLFEPSPVNISWTEVPAAAGYRVLVSANRKFESTLMELKTERNLASLNLDKEGHYFVKVAALGTGEELASDFSEVSTIDYEKKDLVSKVKSRVAPKRTPQTILAPTIAAPQLKLPPNGVSIVSLTGSQEPILFRWEIADANDYRLEIAADDGFQQVLHSAVVGENQLVVTKPLPKGKLYWRVRAQKGSLNSEWSPTFSLEFSK